MPAPVSNSTNPLGQPLSPQSLFASSPVVLSASAPVAGFCKQGPPAWRDCPQPHCGSEADLLKSAKKHKSVIVFWLSGGPSHIDMWDPKPEAPVEIRSPFATLPTKMPGVHFTEHCRCRRRSPTS